MDLTGPIQDLQLAFIYLDNDAALVSVATKQVLAWSINGHGFYSKHEGIPDIHLDSSNIPSDTWTWDDVLAVVATNYKGLISQDLLKDTMSGIVADLDCTIRNRDIPVKGDEVETAGNTAIRTYKSSTPGLTFHVEVHIERTASEVVFKVPQLGKIEAYNSETAAFWVKRHVDIVLEELRSGTE